MASQCRLCLDNRTLKKSHIFPEFLHRPGYDEKGRLLEVRATTDRKLFRQSGFWEKLLCGECEGRFSRFEKYFADLWYETKILPEGVSSSSINISVEYRTFKLFLLSVLWRASVSSLETFKPVQLGIFEEEIRKMLIDREPGPATRFQIAGCVSLFPQSTSPCHGTIVPFSRRRVFSSKTCYSAVFGGVEWYYFVSNQVVESIVEGSLSETGSMLLPVYELSSNPVVERIMTEHFRRGGRRRI